MYCGQSESQWPLGKSPGRAETVLTFIDETTFLQLSFPLFLLNMVLGQESGLTGEDPLSEQACHHI